MSLIYILGKIGPALGLSLENNLEKQWLVREINTASKELYERQDLVDALREQLFALSGSDQQISLPYYVEQIRGLRRPATSERLPISDMRPRYATMGWAEPLLKWREKWKSPLKRPITNEAPPSLSIPDVEAAPFAVVITGSTRNSARITELIIFAAGELEKPSVNQWTEIVGFMNVGPHSYDVTMEDADGVELSVLPNVADRAQYIVAQVIDSAAIAMESPYMVEVLYKNAFLFMRNDYDEFVCSGYDDAIAWQTIGNVLAKQRPAEAALAFQKVKEILGNRDRDRMQSKDKTISFEGDGKQYPFGYPDCGGFGGFGGKTAFSLFPGADRQ